MYQERSFSLAHVDGLDPVPRVARLCSRGFQGRFTNHRVWWVVYFVPPTYYTAHGGGLDPCVVGPSRQWA